MAVEQLPGRVGDFTRYLTGLLIRLDQGAGWCGVFWQRDPEGMRACLDGREIPPWDVVEALLQDLAGRYGAAAAEAETEPARALHAAALAAYDSLPGARDALRDRLDVMLREQRYAAERETRLTRTLSHPGTTPETAASLRLDLAWAHDDHTRATARCTELRSRLTALDAVRRGSGGDREDGAPPTPATGPTCPGPPAADAAAHTAGPGTPASASDASVPRSVSGGPGSVGPAHRPVPAAESGESASAFGTSAPGSVSGGPGSVGPAPAAEPEVSAFGTSAPGGVSGRSGEGALARRPATIDDSASGVPAPGGDSGGPGGFGSAPAAPPEDPARLPGAPTPTTPPENPAPAPTTPPRKPAPTSTTPPRDPAPASTTPPRNPAPTPAVSLPPTPKQRKRRRGGARFAGGVDGDVSPVGPGQGPVPVVPGRRAPRGARFAGAEEAGEQPVPRADVPGEGDRAAVDAVVEGVARLRAGGRSGEAHALLAEAALGPATRFPLLAARLERAGLGADWTTLLWETASLPVGPLVAAADALALAGRAADAEQVLRQGVVRPAAEIGAAVAGLVAEGRRREARALLDVCVRSRTPEDAARSAAPDPETLVPLLLEAAHDVSRERHWDLVHALRVAGFTA
ncbi:hypothetical protein ACGFY8_26695 [Streptomyces sp. NPDC048232]|uniref:hypothetical protein n=1 Tax=Streptomyces sp. NPDC048232 TaxID=3365520 RepID=UPI003710E3B2